MEKVINSTGVAKLVALVKGALKTKADVSALADKADASALANKADVTALNAKVNVSDIVNDLISTDTNKPLSAAQGKALQDAINAIDTTGADISVMTEAEIEELWNANTEVGA